MRYEMMEMLMSKTACECSNYNSLPILRFLVTLLFVTLIIILSSPTISSFGGHDRIYYALSRTPRNRHRLGANQNFGLAAGDVNDMSGRRNIATVPSHGIITRKTKLEMAKFKNFEQVLDTFEETLVVYFSSPTCGPCRIMNKEVKSLRKLVGDDVKVFSLDAERWPSIGSRFKIGALPCLVVFRKGEILTKFEGIHKSEDILKKVQSFL